MENHQGTQFPKATAGTQTLEHRRALLRVALERQPDDERIRQALLYSLSPTYVKKAAQRGIFVCYSRDDELLALDITTDLREVGVQAFLDEIDISEDMEWGEEIGNALRGCGVLLLVLSQDALHDGEVQAERIFFLKTGKVVIPVIARDCDISTLDLALEPIHFEQDYQAGMQKLRALLCVESE